MFHFQVYEKSKLTLRRETLICRQTPCLTARRCLRGWGSSSEPHRLKNLAQGWLLLSFWIQKQVAHPVMWSHPLQGLGQFSQFPEAQVHYKMMPAADSTSSRLLEGRLFTNAKLLGISALFLTSYILIGYGSLGGPCPALRSQWTCDVMWQQRNSDSGESCWPE